MTTETAPPVSNLQPADLASIRNLLPYGWRNHIATATGLTTRQVSEVFNLRTTNPEHNKLVWSIIKRKLKDLQQYDLAEKVKNRITSISI